MKAISNTLKILQVQGGTNINNNGNWTLKTLHHPCSYPQSRHNPLLAEVYNYNITINIVSHSARAKAKG